MKVAIVNTQESFGGAAIAAKRLHHGLLQNDIDSELWVMDKITNEGNVIGPKNKKERVISRFRAALDSLPIWFYTKRRGMFSVSWWNNRNIITRLNSSDADIVHLHWVNAGFLSVSDIGRIKKPIVVTLHDMWYFTGGCHYNNTCQRYKQSCGKCPLLASNTKYDVSYFKHKQKKKLYEQKNITFIPLSNWIASELKNSNIAICNNMIKLPNPIDLKNYESIDKNNARELLGLPLNKKVVTFGAVNSTSDSRKGYAELANALEILDDSDIFLVIFGSSVSSLPKEIESKYNVRCLGYLSDDLTLRIVYSAADIMVVPSREENLSNTIIEALACNTPVVAFDIGGNSDIIKHKVNGYLANYNVKGNTLAEGISYSLGNLKSLTPNTRNSVIYKYDTSVVIHKYIDLYHTLILKGN